MVPIGRKGKILHGRLTGNYVLIQDDLENTGGYLILIASDEDFQHGHDDWVEKDELDAYLEEADWEIEWMD